MKNEQQCRRLRAFMRERCVVRDKGRTKVEQRWAPALRQGPLVHSTAVLCRLFACPLPFGPLAPLPICTLSLKKNARGTLSRVFLIKGRQSLLSLFAMWSLPSSLKPLFVLFYAVTHSLAVRTAAPQSHRESFAVSSHHEVDISLALSRRTTPPTTRCRPSPYPATPQSSRWRQHRAGGGR